MKLTILGSTAGAPSRTNPASGYLVTYESTSLWLDAGTGTFMELAKHVDPGRISAVVLSHIHVDHSSDLFGLYGYLAFGPSGDVPVSVFLPEDGTAHMAAFARASGEHVFNMALGFDEVAGGDQRNVDEAVLTFGEGVHPVPDLVTRVEVGGRSLVYSGDTGPGGDLLKMARGADVLLCEASMQGVRDEQTYPFHMTAREAGEVAAEAGVGRLILTHLGALLDPRQSLEEAAETFTGTITYAAQGAEFDI